MSDAIEELRELTEAVEETDSSIIFHHETFETLLRLARWLCSPGAVTEIRACIVRNSDPTDEGKRAALAILSTLAQHALEERT